MKTPRGVRSSIVRAVDQGVPPGAVAFYARWWQLETWLRQLAYIELRAKYGVGWLLHLQREAPTRAAKDEINKYMATADASNVLACLDVSHLFDLIATADHWPLFEPSLLPRTRWEGLVEELRELRNRNAHCRRPHADDLNRVEQALRDLERGARVALEAFNDRWQFRVSMADPIARGWIAQEHQDASRLVDHCERQYDTRLALQWSVRPWAQPPADDVVAGAEGVFVHATFTISSGYIRPEELWRENFDHPSPLNDHLVFLVVDDPWSLSFAFASIDGAHAINDVIGNAFDAVITGRSPEEFDIKDMDAELEGWARRTVDLDARVCVGTALNVAYPDQPFSVFNAG